MTKETIAKDRHGPGDAVSATARKPSQFTQRGQSFSIQEVLDRAVDFRIVPALPDASRLIHAVNRVLADRRPRIGCFCIPSETESRLYFFELDPTLVPDQESLKNFCKGILGVATGGTLGVSDRKKRAVAKTLVSAGLAKGDPDVRHQLIVDEVVHEPALSDVADKLPVASLKQTISVNFVGSGVSVPSRTISVYFGGSTKTVTVKRSQSESDEELTDLLSALLKEVRATLEVNRTSNGFEIESAVLRRALLACFKESWFKDLNLPEARQASMPA